MKNLVFLIVLTLSSIVYAQSSSIEGKLFDNEFNNEPLAFASVTIKGTDFKTNSDINGFYRFKNLKPGDYTIVYSFVGYENQEKTITINETEKPVINIVMKANSLTVENNTLESLNTNTMNRKVNSSLSY